MRPVPDHDNCYARVTNAHRVSVKSISVTGSLMCHTSEILLAVGTTASRGHSDWHGVNGFVAPQNYPSTCTKTIIIPDIPGRQKYDFMATGNWYSYGGGPMVVGVNVYYFKAKGTAHLTRLSPVSTPPHQPPGTGCPVLTGLWFDDGMFCGPDQEC